MPCFLLLKMSTPDVEDVSVSYFHHCLIFKGVADDISVFACQLGVV